MSDNADAAIKDLLGVPLRAPDTYFIPEPGLAEIPIIHSTDGSNYTPGRGSLESLNAAVHGSPDSYVVAGHDVRFTHGETGHPMATGINSSLIYNYIPASNNLMASTGGVFGNTSVQAASISDHNDWVVHGVDTLPELSNAHPHYNSVTMGDYLSSPDNPTSSKLHGPGVLFDNLFDAVYACKLYIEHQMLVIKYKPDEKLQQLIHLAERGHAASCAQILKENHLIKQFQIDIFNKVTPGPMGIIAFAQNLPYFGTDTGYGRMADYIERVASDDIYGDLLKASLRQGKNQQLLSNLGINTEIFNLPHSTYYRDPSEMYRQAYTGSLPLIPTYQQDQILPGSPDEVYIDTRNQKLIDNGYDPYTMLPAQADETYMKLIAQQADPAVNQQIGLSIIKEAVDRNIKILGKDIYVIDLANKLNKVAEIDGKGLKLLDNQLFIDTMLAVTNKLLFGDIGVTYMENPYETDQMIYGMIELLSQVTPANIDALNNTLLGMYGIDGLLSKIKQVINAITGAIYTGPDRNDPRVWGDAGPDSDVGVKDY